MSRPKNSFEPYPNPKNSPLVGCYKNFTYDRINSASISFGARYHDIFKYVIFFAVRQV